MALGTIENAEIIFFSIQYFSTLCYTNKQSIKYFQNMLPILLEYKIHYILHFLSQNLISTGSLISTFFFKI